MAEPLFTYTDDGTGREVHVPLSRVVRFYDGDYGRTFIEIDLGGKMTDRTICRERAVVLRERWGRLQVAVGARDEQS